MLTSALERPRHGLMACVVDTTDRVQHMFFRQQHSAGPHPTPVPGVLFCNRKLDAADPGVEKLAPAALELFGIESPPWMQGKWLFRFA